MAYGRIYLVTNKLNTKQYVGQTITKHSRHGHGHALKDAYKKYGHSMFLYEKLTEGNLNQMQLDCFEKFWIDVFDCLAPNGYNLEGGGRLGKYAYHAPNLGKKASDSTRKKMSKSQKKHWESLEIHPSLGKKHTDEWKKEASERMKKQVQSEETKLKRSESIKAWHKQRKEALCQSA
jgi:group I intron endonuclease